MLVIDACGSHSVSLVGSKANALVFGGGALTDCLMPDEEEASGDDIWNDPVSAKHPSLAD